MRSLILAITVALAYTLLRGWPAEWPLIVRLALAASILVFALLFWPPARAHPHPKIPFRWQDSLGIITAILFVEGLFLSILTVTPDHSEDLARLIEAEYQDRFGNSQIAQASDSTSLNQAPLIPVVSGLNPFAEQILHRRGTVALSPAPEAYLFPENPETVTHVIASQRHLRSFTLATYQNGLWLPAPVIPETLPSENLTTQLSAASPTLRYRISQIARKKGETLALSLPNPTSINLQNIRKIGPAAFQLPPLPADQRTYEYAVTSAPPPTDLPPAALVPGDSPLPAYLELPLDPRLRSKIQTFASSLGPTPPAALSRLPELFAKDFTYSLEIDLPPGRDALDSFLFETRIGYCTHFATASVMIARALGFPARIAYGWAGGLYYEEPNNLVYRASDAHAWTEIFLRDLGWVTFDTTPRGQRGNAENLSAEGAVPPPLYEDDTQDDGLAARLDRHRLLKISALLAALAGLLCLASLLSRKSPASPDSAPFQDPLLKKAPHYLTAFRRACLKHGFPMPAGRTLRAHLQQIPPLDFADDLLGYHYAVHYGRQKKDRTTEKNLLRRLEHWEKTHPAKVAE